MKHIRAIFFYHSIIFISLLIVSTVTLSSGHSISEKGRRSISPEIAVGPDGALNVIWIDKGLTVNRPPPKPRKPGEHSHRSATDLYFSRSEDGAKTWSKPVKINDQPGEIWGFSVSKPVIEVSPNGTIHVFYPANARSEATGLDVVNARYSHSRDNGKSFSPPITINRPVTQDREDLLGQGLTMSNSFGTMGVAPNGTIFTAWQNIVNMKDAIDGAAGMMAISTDDGESFSTERAVIPGSEVCPCCQFTLAFENELVYMGFRKIFADGGRDSVVAKSIDGGETFTIDGRLDLAPWKINGCPLKPTELGVNGVNVYAVTYTAGEDPAGLYVTASKDGGKTFSGKKQVHPEAAYSDAASLTVDDMGNVRIVWHAKINGPRRLFTSVSLDEGQSFSPPMEMTTPDGKSQFPATTVGIDGTVYVTWEHENEEVFITSLPSMINIVSN